MAHITDFTKLHADGCGIEVRGNEVYILDGDYESDNVDDFSILFHRTYSAPDSVPDSDIAIAKEAIKNKDDYSIAPGLRIQIAKPTSNAALITVSCIALIAVLAVAIY